MKKFKKNITKQRGVSFVEYAIALLILLTSMLGISAYLEEKARERGEKATDILGKTVPWTASDGQDIGLKGQERL